MEYPISAQDSTTRGRADRGESGVKVRKAERQTFASREESLILQPSSRHEAFSGCLDRMQATASLLQNDSCMRTPQSKAVGNCRSRMMPMTSRSGAIVGPSGHSAKSVSSSEEVSPTCEAAISTLARHEVLRGVYEHLITPHCEHDSVPRASIGLSRKGYISNLCCIQGVLLQAWARNLTTLFAGKSL